MKQEERGGRGATIEQWVGDRAVEASDRPDRAPDEERLTTTELVLIVGLLVLAIAAFAFFYRPMVMAMLGIGG